VELAQELNDQGLALRTQRVARERPWTKDLVLRMLGNRVYLGVVHSGGAHYPGEHLALIEAATFAQVQARRALRKRKAGGTPRNPAYLVRGLLKCGSCGSLMTTASTRVKGREYRSYRCLTRNRQGVRSCGTRQLPAEALEGYVVDQLKEALRQGRLSAAGIKEGLEGLEAEKARLEAERKRLQEEASGAGNLEELLELDRALGDLEIRLEEGRWLAGALGDFEGLWELLTPRNRQRLLAGLVEEIVVDEGAGELRITLAKLERRDDGGAGREA
jgi:hypothetical protein